MAPFCGFFAKSTPYILPIDPELIKQILIRDFTNFKNTGFEVIFFLRNQKHFSYFILPI